MAAAGVGKAKAQSAHSRMSKGWHRTQRRLDKVKHLEEDRQALEVPVLRQNLRVCNTVNSSLYPTFPGPKDNDWTQVQQLL